MVFRSARPASRLVEVLIKEIKDMRLRKMSRSLDAFAAPARAKKNKTPLRSFEQTRIVL